MAKQGFHEITEESGILREQDQIKRNETIAEQEFEIKLPSKTEYVVLQDEKENTKAKLRIQATRTRY